MRYDKKIPILPKVEGWKNIKIEKSFFSDELVSVGLFSDYSEHFFVDPIYSGLMNSSPYKCGELNGLVGAYLLKSIAGKLLKAKRNLKPRHMFLIWDAYRPLGVQKSLFDFYVSKLIYLHGGKASDYTNEAQKYVSLPSNDLKKPSPHSTGAVVDLTIIEFTESGWERLQYLNKKLRSARDEKLIFSIEMERFMIMRQESFPIEMGTMFDEMSEVAGLYYFENKQTTSYFDLLVKNNRRYLFNILHSVGFVGYDEEWWHFSFGDQFWAKKMGKTAKHTFAKFNLSCEVHEEMIRNVMKGIETIQSGFKPSNKLNARHILYDFVFDVANRTGDIRRTNHPLAISL